MKVQHGCRVSKQRALFHTGLRLQIFWCGGVFLVCFCGGLLCCFCGGFVVRLGWCFCGGVLAVFLWWCVMVVFLLGFLVFWLLVWWGFLGVFLWWCFVLFLWWFWCWCGGGIFWCVFVVVFYVFSVVVLVVVVVLWGRSASSQCVRCRKAASPCRLEGGKMCADVWQIKDEGRPFWAMLKIK